MRIIFLLIVLFIAIISGCTLFGAGDVDIPAGISADSADYEAYATCVQDCDSCKDDCLNRVYYQKALGDENKNVCDTITSVSLKQECVQTILASEAVSQLNKEKCSKLTEEALQISCVVHVSAEIAVQSSDVEKCTDSPDVERCQNIFYRDMAILNNDAAYCDNIAGEAKELCYEVVGVVS